MVAALRPWGGVDHNATTVVDQVEDCQDAARQSLHNLQGVAVEVIHNTLELGADLFESLLKQLDGHALLEDQVNSRLHFFLVLGVGLLDVHEALYDGIDGIFRWRRRRQRGMRSADLPGREAGIGVDVGNPGCRRRALPWRCRNRAAKNKTQREEKERWAWVR